MDIYNLYMGESYGSLRNPVTFRDYEKHPYGSWEKTTANKGSYYQQQQNKGHSVQSRGDHHGAHNSGSDGKAKEKCPFCKEQKKRPLVNYIRKRENKKHNESICEEEEEEEEECEGGENVPQNKSATGKAQ